MEVLTVLVAVVALIIAVGLLFSLPVMLLWTGCLVGAINGVNEITWLQAWGILVLCGLLFKTQLSKKD